MGGLASMSRAAVAKPAKGTVSYEIEMHFLPDIYVPCEVCKGKRYNRETLEVNYKGKSIADVLDMTIEQARDFFAPIRKNPQEGSGCALPGRLGIYAIGAAEYHAVRRRSAACEACY